MSLREILTSPNQPWRDLIVDTVTANTSISNTALTRYSLHDYTDGAIINIPPSDIVSGYVSIGTRLGAGGGVLTLPLGTEITAYIDIPIGTGFSCLFVGNGSTSSTLLANTGCTFNVASGSSNINLGSARSQTTVYFVKTGINTYVAHC